MRRVSPVLIALCALAAYGCGDTFGPARRGPDFSIQDATHANGNAHFYWSAPIVSNPVTGGIFDPTYQPVVEVCEWNGSACVATVAEFRTGKGTGGATIKVDVEGERYHVNWHTGQCRSGSCVLDPRRTYRIRVLVGGLEAGFADVDVVSSRGEAKNVNTGEYVALVDGTTLPIRFRLERGLTLVNPAASALPALRHASQRYRNEGVKPGTGRDGSAVVQGRALLSRDGTTLVELTTGRLDLAGAAPGKVEKVQFKQLDANGASVNTLNFTGLSGGGAWSRTLSGFPRRASLQLQANVSGIDAERTSVVTVPVTVALRPDLAVKDLAAPATTSPGVPTVITALVGEKNGDVGATGDCRLYVDDTLADEAPAVWVDAGDDVSCNFVHTFVQAGTYTVRVAFENVTPGDDDAGNNAVTGSLSVVNTAVTSEAFAEFANDDFTRSGNFSWQSTRTDDETFLLYEQFDVTEQVRRKYLSGWHQWQGNGEIAFPLASVRVFQGSGAAVSADYTLTGVAATYSSSWDYNDPWGRQWGHDSCYSGPAPAGQSGWVVVCTTAGNYQPHGEPAQSNTQTWAVVAAARGRVQYYSRDFYHRIYTPAGEDYTGESLYSADDTYAGTIGEPGAEMNWVLNVSGVEPGTGDPLTFTSEVSVPWETSSWTEDGTEYCDAGSGTDEVWVFEYRNCSAVLGFSHVGFARKYPW